MSEHTPNVAVNWQKFMLLASSLALMAGMVVTGRVEWADVSTPFGLIIGYGTANGIGAAKGQATTPVFRPTHPRRRSTDTGTADLDDLDDLDVGDHDDPDPTATLRAERRAERRATAEARRNREAD